MEFYGLTIFTLAALLVSLGMGFLALLLPRLRRFALAICATPPVAVAFLFFAGWAIKDSGPVCGPVPEWDHCPSLAARIFIGLAWTVGVFAVGVGAYWGQKVIQAAANLWVDTKPIKLFKDQ